MVKICTVNPHWIIQFSFISSVLDPMSQGRPVFAKLDVISRACGQIEVPHLFVLHTPTQVVFHFLFETPALFHLKMSLNCICRATEPLLSMEVQDMDNSSNPWVSSTYRSRPPSPCSPQCTWLTPRWPTPSTTTCATPSSPCCAAACPLELLPSSTPSQWVWFTSISTLYGPVRSRR